MSAVFFSPIWKSASESLKRAFADFEVFSRRKSWWLLRKTTDVTLPVRLKVIPGRIKGF